MKIRHIQSYNKTERLILEKTAEERKREKYFAEGKKILTELCDLEGDLDDCKMLYITQGGEKTRLPYIIEKEIVKDE